MIWREINNLGVKLPVTKFRYIKSRVPYDSDFVKDKRYLSNKDGIHLEFKVIPDREDKINQLDFITKNNTDWEQYYDGLNNNFIIAQTIDWNEPLSACNDIQPNRRAKVLEPRGIQYFIAPRDEDSYFEPGFRQHIAKTIIKFMKDTNVHLFEMNFCPEPVNIPNGWHVPSERVSGWISLS